MLCTSILSEVVLGFMLWSGWLGITHTSEAPLPEFAQAPVPSVYEPMMPVGQACPRACVECPAPTYYPQPSSPVTTGTVEVCKIVSMSPRLAACDVKEVYNTAAATSLPCKKPCSWRIQNVVKSPVAGGLDVEFTLDAENDGVKEVYKARKIILFDSLTDVTLLGNHPEPVCIQVMARRLVQIPPQPQIAALWNQGTQPYSPPIPVSYAVPTFPPLQTLPMPMASSLVKQGPATIPDPIPLYPSASPYAPPLPPIMPISLVLPPPTPVSRASVRLVYESGKARLSVKSQGMTSECVRMKLEAGVAGAVRLSAGKNHVHLAGTKWKAEADHVELGDDGRIVLAGHVKLTSDKLGVCAAVKADRLCVQVKSGKFEKIIDSK